MVLKSYLTLNCNCYNKLLKQQLVQFEKKKKNMAADWKQTFFKGWPYRKKPLQRFIRCKKEPQLRIYEQLQIPYSRSLSTLRIVTASNRFAKNGFVEVELKEASLLTFGYLGRFKNQITAESGQCHKLPTFTVLFCKKL